MALTKKNKQWIAAIIFMAILVALVDYLTRHH